MLLLVDIVLGLIVLEALALIVLLGRSRGAACAARDVVPNLAAGGCLVLALRSVLAGSAAGWTVLFLSLALAAHLVDLHRRHLAGNR